MTRARYAISAIVASATIAAIGAYARPARAQAADAGAPSDIASLEDEIARARVALQTEDCATACKALSSLLRAADKLCALDPGPRCSAARAKADDATSRVRAACPDCAQVGVTIPPPPTDETEREETIAAAASRGSADGRGA
jgi:hypothetical protein